MKKVLVFGKRGQVASSLNSIVSNSEYKFIFIGSEEMDFNFINKNSIEDLLKQLNPILVINTSGFTKVDDAELNPNEAMKINGIAVGLIAESCYKRSIPLIHLSSDYVFGDNSSKLINPLKKTNPLGRYGKSKQVGEELIKKASKKYKMGILIIRLSWVYNHDGDNFIKKILNQALNKKEIKVVSDQFGGPTSAYSIAKTILKLTNYVINNDHPTEKNKSFPWGIYHFQGRPLVSWYDFANIILEKSYKLKIIENIPQIIPISSRELNSIAKRPKNSRLDCSESEKTLGLSMPNWEIDLEYFLKSQNG
ncbi:MAG: dTDP-4-dehydrorhamnose reductase [Euryarchaeota archaeon]|nr:dTDP-4-dehydrorhamnose reductase [Euryarchaeota archaeon]|tara:strand:- start:3157 stop:4080 length:924 start_codon:yes stop_codon:yes gene_type:complete